MKLRVILFFSLVALVMGPTAAQSAGVVAANISGFQATKSSLTKNQLQTLLRIASRTDIAAATCLGYVKSNSNAAERNLAKARATTVCRELKLRAGAIRTNGKVSPTSNFRLLNSVGLLLTPKPQSEPQPNEQAAPVPSVRTNSPFYSYRMNADGIIERRGSLESQWFSTSGNRAGISPTRTAAYEAIKANMSAVPRASSIWAVGPTVPLDMLRAYQIQMNEALKYLPFEGMTTPVEVLVVTERDRDFVRSFWARYFQGSETAARIERSLDAYGPDQRFRSVAGGAHSRIPMDSGVSTVGINFTMGSLHAQETHLLIEHVAHEATHTWQFFAFGQTSLRSNTPGPNVTLLVPCHLTEGGANTLGAAIASPHLDWYSEATNVIVRRVISEIGGPPKTPDEVISLLRLSESWSTCQSGYAIGALAYEWLISQHGTAKFFKLHSEIIRLNGFDRALNEVYGFGKEEFYRMVSPYVLEAVRSAG